MLIIRNIKVVFIEIILFVDEEISLIIVDDVNVLYVVSDFNFIWMIFVM